MAKDFSNNPAFNLLSGGYTEAENNNPELTRPQATPKTKKPASSSSGEKKPATKKQEAKIMVKAKKEIKNKHASLLLTESLYKKIDNYAKKIGCSFNDVVTQILDQVELN